MHLFFFFKFNFIIIFFNKEFRSFAKKACLCTSNSVHVIVITFISLGNEKCSFMRKATKWSWQAQVRAVCIFCWSAGVGCSHHPSLLGSLVLLAAIERKSKGQLFWQVFAFNVSLKVCSLRGNCFPLLGRAALRRITLQDGPALEWIHGLGTNGNGRQRMHGCVTAVGDLSHHKIALWFFPWGVSRKVCGLGCYEHCCWRRQSILLALSLSLPAGFGSSQGGLEEPAPSDPQTYLLLERGNFPNGPEKNFPFVILEITGHAASPSDSCTITCGQAEVSILERHPSDGRSCSIFVTHACGYLLSLLAVCSLTLPSGFCS